jgi:hypothetical protein
LEKTLSSQSRPEKLRQLASCFEKSADTMRDPEDYWVKSINAMRTVNPGQLESLWEMSPEQLDCLVEKLDSSCLEAGDYVRSIIKGG